jgi:hypothetical protein
MGILFVYVFTYANPLPRYRQSQTDILSLCEQVVLEPPVSISES